MRDFILCWRWFKRLCVMYWLYLQGCHWMDSFMLTYFMHLNPIRIDTIPFVIFPCGHIQSAVIKTEVEPIPFGSPIKSLLHDTVCASYAQSACYITHAFLSYLHSKDDFKIWPYLLHKHGPQALPIIIHIAVFMLHSDSMFVWTIKVLIMHDH